MLVSTSMASSAAGGRGDVRGVAVVVGGRWGMPCGGVILSAGGALTGSTSMAVGGGGGGGAEDGGGGGGDGGDRRNRCRQGDGRGAGGVGRVSSGGEGGSRGACWDRQVWCGGAHIHRRGGMR